MDIENDILIDRRQLRERVLDSLRALILNGELHPGEFIRQQHIAEQFGVSQMPVREALKELAAEGLVENIPYRGVRVIQYSLNDINDLFALRSFLEGRTAKDAALFISNDEVDHLFQLTEKMKEAIISKQETMYRSLNSQFHQSIYRASRSSFFIQTLDKLWSTYPTILGNFLSSTNQPVPASDDKDNEEHYAIVEALRNRDAESAEKHMQEHIQFAGNELVRTLKEHGSKEVTLG